MNKKRILSVVVGLALVFLVGFVGYQLGVSNTEKATNSKTAKTVAAGFIASLTSGDVAQARAAGSSYYRAQNTVDALQAASDKLASDNIKISEEEIYFGRDTVSGQAIYTAKVDNLPASEKTGSTAGDFVVRMVYEDGFWKVDSLKVY